MYRRPGNCHGGSSELLRKIALAYGLLLGDAEERISIEIASPVAVEALNLTQGATVLTLDRVIKTRDGQPAEWRIAQCALDQMHYLVEMA